eukprot:CAMPEP_0172940274 /NCGR_PEP_ID=MMETSP1075-20121228/223950_1 /TAXON_ID=2916 /ORGANISM="Ceratium fusus, Strain PA161109" /LENGTH=81 /DNA_ID=CAMNT_0013801669 /DNA_START=1203 /DNA_END=1448 /DNA_ORIENTATION=-
MFPFSDYDLSLGGHNAAVARLCQFQGNARTQVGPLQGHPAPPIFFKWLVAVNDEIGTETAHVDRRLAFFLQAPVQFAEGRQ